jgi:hypothetical protein
MRPERRARAGVEGGPKSRPLLFQLKSDFFLPPFPTPNSEEALFGWLVEEVLEDKADLVCASGFQVGIGDV